MALSRSVSGYQSDECAEFAIFFTKLVAMATSLQISEKKVQIIHLHQNTFIQCEKIAKIGTADSEIIVL